MHRIVALSLLAVGCQEYNLEHKGDPVDPTGSTPTTPVEQSCEPYEATPATVEIDPPCEDPNGHFDPVLKWSYGEGRGSRATVSVGDLDGDGMPEIVSIIEGLLPTSTGDLVVLHGDGTEDWTVQDELGMGSSPAIGDLDGDKVPEIVVVRQYKSSLPFGTGDYTGVCFDNQGNQVWESEHFPGDDFDYATAPVLADLDGDGSPEVVLGRVILRADGSTRGVGAYGRGSYGIVTLGGVTVSESAVPAVADIDLDGVQEVVVGDAVYDADGNAKWHDPKQEDAMIAIANLDNDPEGEFVGASYNTVRAVDTNGRVMWGPTEIKDANIVSPPAVADLDGDGKVEIIVAGGSRLVVFHADGTKMWSAPVTDLTGASGASVFDFEGDGIPEVVYIDEVEMYAFDGLTGAVKFHNTEHDSDTMMDYPVIADIDADGHADIVVANLGPALTVFTDKRNSWAPARTVWNQHAYSITNVNDDLTIPAVPVQNFTTYNSWHAATGEGGSHGHVGQLQAEILDLCSVECDTKGSATVWGRLVNKGGGEVSAGVPMALYAQFDTSTTLLDVQETPAAVPPGTTSDPIAFTADAIRSAGAIGMLLVADDDGTGVSAFFECDETDNVASRDGAICP